MDFIPFIFIYAFISHGLLGASYYKKINDGNLEKILYFSAHVFIALAFFLRQSEIHRRRVYVPIIGNIGHSSLLIFFILTTFVLHKKYRVSFSGENINLNLLCILGQIGMIIMYWIEYSKENKLEIYKRNEYIIKPFKIIIFLMLAYFYVRVAFKEDNKYSNIFVGLLMICILYILLTYGAITDKI